MALSIDIAANTRAASSQVKDLGDDLGNVVSALDDVGQGARGAGDKLERALADAERQARQTDRAVDDIGTTGGTAFGKVRTGAQEVTQEVGQNLGEAVSSIRGDISDLGQVGQDTLGGLAATVAGTGPAGLLGALALAAGAAGLGAVTAGMEEAKQKQEQVNEAAANFASGYIDGINGALSAAYVFAEINAIITDPERYKAAQEAAADWGVAPRAAVAAMAGDTTALALAQQSLAERTAQADAALQQQEQQVDGNAGAAYDLADSVARGADKMSTLTDALRLGKEQADVQAQALYDIATSSGQATDATDDLGNAIYRLPDGKEIVVDAKTGRAYEDMDALERKQFSPKTVPVVFKVDDREVQFYKPPGKQGVIEYKAAQAAWK